MAVTRFWISKTEVKDDNDRATNFVRETLHVITSEKTSWTRLSRESVIPRHGSEHPKEPGFFLESMEPSHVKIFEWEVKLEYVPFKEEQVDANPLARPAVITWSTSLIDTPVSRDSEGRFIGSAAGELITGVMQKVPLVEYSVKKNLAKDPDWIQTHFGAVNADRVRLRNRDWDPKTLLLISGSGGEFQNENKQDFFELSFSLLADARGWTVQVWNKGTVRLERVSRLIAKVRGDKLVWSRVNTWVQVPIMVGTPPQATEEPVFLDRDGQEVAEHLQPGVAGGVDVSKVISLDFQVQPILKFGGVLNLK